MESPRVSIVLPVFNAPREVALCLESLRELLSSQAGLCCHIVDDGSEAATRTLLADFCTKYEGFSLTTNPSNRGYTPSVNTGIAAVLPHSDFICILNSDCEVPPDLIAKLLPLFDESKWIGIVGPVSNAASYQSLPRVHDLERRGFATNSHLLERFSLEQLNDVLDDICSVPGLTPPIVSLFNGFCSLVRADVFREIGLFDEALFPIGYGEETDFALRAEDAGWVTKICMNSFVWHHKSRSFGSDRRKVLAQAGRKALVSKYGKRRLETAEGSLAASAQLRWLRESFEQRIGKRDSKR